MAVDHPAHHSEFRRWSGGVDRRICQTFAASPAERGELPLVFRPDKLGLEPNFQVIALYLPPVPLTLRNFEAFAFGDYPKNTSIRRGCRPDVHAGTLHKRDILVLARGDGLARRGISGRRGRGNLGRVLESHGRGKIRPGDRSWCCKRSFRDPRGRLNRSDGCGLSGFRSFRLFSLACGWPEDVRKRTYS